MKLLPSWEILEKLLKKVNHRQVPLHYIGQV